MYRKILGVFTAVAAALLLVGVAWASGASDDSSSGSVSAAAGSDVCSSVSLASRVTATSGQDSTPTSLENTAPTSVDDGTSTSIRVVDTSSTSTTVDSSTSTTLGEGSISTSLDISTSVDDDRAVTIATEPRTYDVDGAGTVGIQVVAGRLVLLDVGAASGWSVQIDKADSRDIRVEFENGDSDARFEAKIRDGELTVEMRRD